MGEAKENVIGEEVSACRHDQGVLTLLCIAAHPSGGTATERPTIRLSSIVPWPPSSRGGGGMQYHSPLGGGKCGSGRVRKGKVSRDRRMTKKD